MDACCGTIAQPLCFWMIASIERLSSTRFLPSLIICFAVSKHTRCTFAKLLIVRLTPSRMNCKSATETET